MSDPKLLLRCNIEREISADVIIYGDTPSVKGLDKVIEMLVMTRNNLREGLAAGSTTSE